MRNIVFENFSQEDPVNGLTGMLLSQMTHAEASMKTVTRDNMIDADHSVMAYRWPDCHKLNGGYQAVAGYVAMNVKDSGIAMVESLFVKSDLRNNAVGLNLVSHLIETVPDSM